MATIQIADNDARVQYTQAITANSTQLTIDFPFFALDDIKVVVTNASGVDTTLSRGTGTGTFAVTGTAVDDGFSGGHITLGDSYANTTKTTIFRDIPITRTTDFPTSGPFNVASLNTELDKLTAVAQQNETSFSRTLQLSDSDETVDLKLPNKDTRKSKTLAFNATTGVPEAGPSISDVQTVSAASADIAALADIEDGTIATDAISDLAAIKANVTTVAGIASNVTSVASNASNINSVAGNATNINTVAGKESEITSVAAKASLLTSDFVSDLNTLAVTDVINDINTLATSDIVSDLNTLATSDIVSDLNTLATSDIVSDINTLATSDIVTDLNLLATSDFVSDLNTIATTTNVNNLATVAGAVSNVNTVAGISSDVTAVAGISSDVAAVEDIAANVTSVAGNASNINAAVSNASNINAVVSNASNINSVAGIAANVTTVAGIASNVTTVAGAASNVSTVAGAITNVNNVGGSIANVNTVATNISGVNSFAERYRVGSSDPSSSLDAGDLAYNTSDNALKYYTGSAWASITAGIGNIVEDTSPQLGGALDVNGNSITSASNGDITIDPNGTGDIVLDANVGIGTATPEDFGGGYTTLEVAGSSTANGGIFKTATSDSAGTGTAGTEMLMYSNNGGGVIAVTSSDPLLFQTAGAERMRLTSAGLLGVNTTSPSAQVDVRTAALGTALQLSDNTNYGVNFLGVSGGLRMKMNGAQTLTIDQASNANVFHINGSGNIGIGTTTEGISDYGDTLTLADSNHCGMTIRSGTSSEGNVYFSDGTSGDAEYKGIVKYDHSSNAMSFWSNSSRRMDITSGGNVGIGTSSPTLDGSLAGLSVNGSGTVLHVNDGDGATLKLTDPATGANRGFGITLQGTSAAISNCESGELRFGTGNTERARFDSSGNFMVGKTSGNIATAGIELRANDDVLITKDGNTSLYLNRLSSNGTTIEFHRSSSNIGNVSVSTVGVTYNTTSDIRLKQDIEPLVATDKLMAMNPVSYNWKADPDGPRSMGFIAQEMQEVMPEAVSTGDDDDAMMSMDYGRITPILVSALQDAHRKIEQLESRIAAMEIGNE